jgi:hypothetical protein
MLSNFIDWMLDGLYGFKWLAEDIAKWWFNSLKALDKELKKRGKHENGNT